MKLLPSFEAFEQAWLQGKNQMVYARLAADLDTPVSLMLKLANAGKDAFMLESVTGGEVRGRRVLHVGEAHLAHPVTDDAQPPGVGALQQAGDQVGSWGPKMRCGRRDTVASSGASAARTSRSASALVRG